MYALNKTINLEGQTYELPVLKCKGYSQNDKKLSYSDFERMEAGGILTQKQSQFRCPKSNYVSETDAFTITTQVVGKSFRKIYSKGVVGPTGTVEPHEI